MRGFDISSWQGVLSTLLGLSLVTLIMVGVRLLIMQTVQQRRERENRQINERLRTLIAAYKTLGGSFTGDFAVDPSHLRDLRSKATDERASQVQIAEEIAAIQSAMPSNDRSRRMIAVELVKRNHRVANQPQRGYNYRQPGGCI